MDKTFCREFPVQHSQADFLGNLSLPHLGDIILNLAGMHADSLGIGIRSLQERGLTWVLAELSITPRAPVKIGSVLRGETGIAEFNRITSRRFFRFYDGETLTAEAYSLWTVIDLEKRKPVNLTGIMGRLAELQQPEAAPARVPRPRFSAEPGSRPAAVRKITYSQIDINRHLYSIEYLKMALDLFPPERFSARGIRGFTINFAREIRHGEEISLHLCGDDAPNPETSRVEIQNAAGESCARAEIAWGPLS